MADIATSKGTIHLSTPGDWRLWYKYILGEAMSNDVLDFIDLKKPQLFSELEPPKRPKRPETPTLESRALYDVDMTDWKADKDDYNLLKAGMAKIRSTIWRTVDANELRHIRNENEDVKEILNALRIRLCPTTSDYQSDVRSRYYALCKAPKGRSIENWLSEWALIKDDIRDAKIAGQFAIETDFLNANLAIDSGYAQAWAMNIEGNGVTISFVKLVEHFKKRYRDMGILKGDNPMNFATLNGRPQQQNISSTPSSPATFQKCICGARHRYAQCYYLNPSKKPSGWEENREKRAQINQALKDPKLKGRVDRAISRESSANTDMIEGAVLGGMVLKRPADSNISATELIPQSIDLQIRKISMNSSNSRSYLRNSWIFGTGAEQHICNNRTRFLSFTPANVEVYTGDSSTKIEGYGTVRTIMINEAGKQFNVNLTNAAYIPNFHTNIIAWKPCFHIGGIYYDGKDFRLRKRADNSIFARVEVFGGLLVTEYNSGEIAAFSTILDKSATAAAAATTPITTKKSEKSISSNSSTSSNPSSNLPIRTKPSQKPKISIEIYI
ncbi:hypothetical protein GX50_07792 [[Emmonsia] crescens]|uniref:Retrovirus-related Pol polyprotein from transposon TNT 1-94-like beta-barrel domain-containing protein n=1 Tax=[Emmonsia] crescens TaxID=73230 RepID=A0A2B7Z9F9_9EURO|nr:hypothetical protein GX50_07792 [Emmonsia crescens]